MISRRRWIRSGLALAAAGLSGRAPSFVGGPAFISSSGYSPPANFPNVNFLLHGTALPLYDVGNIGLGVENDGLVIDTGTKPSFLAGSLSVGAGGTNHAFACRAPETGSNFKLGTAFCIEAHVRCGTGGARIFDTRTGIADNSGWTMGIQATTLYPFLTVGSSNAAGGGTTYGVSSPTPSGALTANTWAHVRFTYDGTTARVFVDGVITWSAAATIDISTGSHLVIANVATFNLGVASQYLAGLRIVKGEPVSTQAFTSPSDPWPDSGAVISAATNVTYSNVVLRSNYDSNVADQSNAARIMTAAGNATIDTSVKKFGAGSLILDGTGDYVTAADSADFDMGTGDYQFQAWVYRNTATGRQIVSCYTGSTAGYSLALNGSNVPAWNETGDGVDGVFVTAIGAATWTHVAVGRKGGILYTYVNGVLQSFVSSGQTVNCAGTMFVGRLNNSFGSLDWQGNIDDLQLVKGECQLYRSFLVPTAALPTS